MTLSLKGQSVSEMPFDIAICFDSKGYTKYN